MTVSLAAIAAKAGNYPAYVKDFGRTIAKFAESVKAYVDAQILARAVSKNVEFAALAVDYAITATDGYENFVVNDAISITLPVAADNVGRKFGFVLVAAAVLTIAQNADDANIAGADADYTTLDAAGDRVELISDGLEWLIVSSTIA